MHCRRKRCNTLKEKAVKEVNAGIYCLNWAKVKGAFSDLKTNNAQKEYYLTDIIAWGKKEGLKCQCVYNG
jgi:bifunctional UDP-N-acetylglucosamine pyrophosphorylase/glucosamine-1-phosphate N-acetyltransferase